MIYLFATLGGCLPADARPGRTSRGGGGGVVTPGRCSQWGDYLTIADLDSSGSADSDPGSILTSLTEPATGELLLSIAPDGTTRDGTNEGVKFDITSSAGGWWDASEMIAGGPGMWVTGLEILSLSDHTAQPLVGIGVYSTADSADSIAVGSKLTTTNHTASISSGTSNNFAGGRAWSGGAQYGAIYPAVDTESADGSLGYMVGMSMTFDSSGVSAAPEHADHLGWLRNVLDDPTSWTAFLWVGNDLSNSTAFQLKVKARNCYGQWRPGP